MFEQPPTFGPIEDETFEALSQQYPKRGETFHGDVGKGRYDPTLDILLTPVTKMIVAAPEAGLNNREPSLIRYIFQQDTVAPGRTLTKAGWHTDDFKVVGMTASPDEQTTIFAVRDKAAEAGLSLTERFRLWQARREFLAQYPPTKTFKGGINEADMERLRLKNWRAKAGYFAVFHAGMPHMSPINETNEPRSRSWLQAAIIHKRRSLTNALLDRL